MSVFLSVHNKYVPLWRISTNNCRKQQHIAMTFIALYEAFNRHRAVRYGRHEEQCGVNGSCVSVGVGVGVAQLRVMIQRFAQRTKVTDFLLFSFSY